MHEHVRTATILSDKPESLLRIEPLDSTRSHVTDLRRCSVRALMARRQTLPQQRPTLAPQHHVVTGARRTLPECGSPSPTVRAHLLHPHFFHTPVHVRAAEPPLPHGGQLWHAAVQAIGRSACTNWRGREISKLTTNRACSTSTAVWKLAGYRFNGFCPRSRYPTSAWPSVASLRTACASWSHRWSHPSTFVRVHQHPQSMWQRRWRTLTAFRERLSRLLKIGRGAVQPRP